MGAVFVALAVFIVTLPVLRKRSALVDSILSRPVQWLQKYSSDKSKKRMMLVIASVASVVFFYCLTRSYYSSLTTEVEQNIFQVFGMLSLRVFPFFIVGCFMAGVIEKYFQAGRIPIPQTMIGNGVFASLIPLCSCSVVPLAQSMTHLHRIRLRAVITFLMVAPVLNPMVIALSLGTLGVHYLALRVVTTFALGMITGIFIERLAGVKEEGEQGVFSCVGCSKSSAVKPEHADSALMLSWNTMVNLMYYIIVGVAIGAIFTVYFPPPLVGKYLSNGSLGLFLSVLIGLPLYICSGEEVLILAPLMEMGLPMGHAIAFTITGNAICVTSISVMIPVFGKRATFIMVGALFFGAILAGAIINAAEGYWPMISGLIQ